MKRALCGFLFCFLVLSLAKAGENDALLKVNPFKFVDISPDEGKLIESLVYSYVSEIPGITVYQDLSGVDGKNKENPQSKAGAGATRGLQEAPNELDVPIILPEPQVSSIAAEPDYTLNGKIYTEGGERVISIDMSDNKTHSKPVNLTASFKTASEMALKVRSMVEDNIKTLSDKNKHSRGLGEALKIGYMDLAGSWHGDNGIEIIRFAPGERALAIFSSGESMELSYKIDGKTLTITQTSKNNYRYYYHLTEKAARILEEKAAPMRWEFHLYDGGKTLEGQWISSQLVGDAGAKVSGAAGGKGSGGDANPIIKSVVKDAKWTKLSY